MGVVLMEYYIRTKKELDFDLSDAFTSHHDAKQTMDKMHIKNKENSKIIEIPEIRNGLNLFRGENSYYGTIIGTGSSLYFISDLSKEDYIPDPFDKQRLFKRFVEEVFLPIESYCEGIEFHNVKDFDIDNILSAVDFTKEND
jgi:hypothetical protein